MLCDNNEQNLFLSSNIIKIEYDAFSFKKDVESITSNTLEKIESFKNLKNLIKLDTPNLNTFPLISLFIDYTSWFKNGRGSVIRPVRAVAAAVAGELR